MPRGEIFFCPRQNGDVKIDHKIPKPRAEDAGHNANQVARKRELISVIGPAAEEVVVDAERIAGEGWLWELMGAHESRYPTQLFSGSISF